MPPYPRSLRNTASITSKPSAAFETSQTIGGPPTVESQLVDHDYVYELRVPPIQNYRFRIRMRSSASMAEKAAKPKKGEQLTQEKILATFQQLRQEQRTIANKIAELESEKNEHK